MSNFYLQPATFGSSFTAKGRLHVCNCNILWPESDGDFLYITKIRQAMLKQQKGEQGFRLSMQKQHCAVTTHIFETQAKTERSTVYKHEYISHPTTAK